MAAAESDPAARLAAALREAWVNAGEPPYREMARAAMISPASISRAFSGKKVPRWELVYAILGALKIGSSAVESEWRPMWRAAREAGLHLKRAPGPVPPENDQAAPPAARTCEDCGALIGDLLQHQAWHWRIEHQLGRAPLRAIDGGATP